MIAALSIAAAAAAPPRGWQEGLAQGFEPLPGRQQLTAILLAAGILVLVVELVRRRRLREEYSWVWVVVALALLTLALTDGPLLVLTQWIGAASAVSTLFFGGILFLMLLALQFSVRLSRLTQRHKSLAQRTALLERELDDLRRQVGGEQRDGADSTIRPLHTAARTTAQRRQQEDSA